MEYEKEHDLRVSQLSFIGIILSGFTHEIKNHLAFIKESAGLIGDIIESRKSLAKQDLQQTVNIIHSITNQIGKTSELCNYLNCFAHRMDSPMSTFSVNESIEELIVLFNRFANQRRISLETDFQKNLPLINSDASRLQFLIFCFIEEMIRKLDKNSRITVKTASSKDSIMIWLIQEGSVITPVEEKSPCLFELRHDVIKQLGGNLSQEDKEVIIVIPLSSQTSFQTG